MANTSDRFEKYGAFNLINALAEGDPLRYEQITQLPHGVALINLMIKDDIARTQFEAEKRALNKIKKK
jgi:hypothetical protein